MCGRYALRISAPELARVLGVAPGVEHAPRYNIAPTQSVPVLRLDADAVAGLVAMRWGLVPSWSKGPDARYSMFNARVEGLASKPAYRGPVRRRRCLVPADGWYEWQGAAGRKQPFFVHSPEDALLCFAGLWDRWQRDDGSVLESCTIVTGDACASLAPIHPRMPLLVTAAARGAWLDPGLTDPRQALALLDGATARDLIAEPVSSRVNDARNDDASCVTPLRAP